MWELSVDHSIKMMMWVGGSGIGIRGSRKPSKTKYVKVVQTLHRKFHTTRRNIVTTPKANAVPTQRRDDGTHFRKNEDIIDSAAIQLNWMISIPIDISLSRRTHLLPLPRKKIAFS